MACKGESDLEKFETEFAGGKIDLRCFAYDFFVYSADTCGISVICEWQDTANDYLRSDLMFVISRLVFKHQIEMRFKLNEIFESYYEVDKLESFNGVSDLWVTAVVCTMKKYWIRTLFTEVEVLLALTNELIQFLYSKKCELYLQDLAKLWSDWISVEKRQFEECGGITKMYENGLKPCYQFLGDFKAKYIKEYYVPYEKFAGDKTLRSRIIQLLQDYEKTWRPRSEEYENKTDDCSKDLEEYLLEITISISTLKQNKSSGSELYRYAAMEKIPRREILRLIRTTAISDALQLQSIPEQNLQELARSRPKSSNTHRRRRNTKHSSFATNEQALNQMSLQSRRAERSRKPSAAAKVFQKLLPKDKARKESSGKQKSLQPEGTLTSALFCNLRDGYQAIIEKKRRRSEEQKIRNTDDGSCPIGEQAVDPQASSSEQKEQSRKNISSPCEERGSEMVSFEASQSSVSETYDATQCQRSTGAIRKTPLGDRRGSSGKQERQRKPSALQTVEQAIQQMSIDSSEGRLSSDNKPDVSEAHGETSVHNVAGTNSQNPAKEYSESPSRTKSKRKSKRSSRKDDKQ